MFRVGFGRAVITPPLPTALAGFIDPQVATEVHDDLEACALMIQGPDGVGVCLVVCDLLNMSPEFAEPARAAVAEETGLDAPAVLIACTHTHSGPSAMRGTEALGWATPDGYLEILVAGCRRAAAGARAGMRETTARYLRGALPHDLSINRRGHPYAPWFAALEFPHVAVMANIGIHPVALGPECLAVSADWVGAFRAALERRAGVPALLLSSALGDVNPNHVHRQKNSCTRDGFEEAATLGAELADVVDDARGTGRAIESSVAVVAQRTFDMPIDGTRLASGRRRPTLPVELVEWSVGPVRVVSIPGEAFHALGREIDDSRNGMTLLAGLSPNWLGYLPVPYEPGGYEEETSYGPDAVAMMRDMLLNVPHLGHLR